MVDENKPTPDPTVLTTEQLERAIMNVKELMTSELKGIVAVFEERFNSIAVQLALIASQRIEQKDDTSVAVQAALSAAKEAVKEQTAAAEKSILKTENSTAEQMKQMTTTFTVANEGLSLQIGDVKDRVAKIENVKQGGREAIAGLYALGGFVGALVLIVGGLAAAGVFAK
jgi:Cu/Ag efflux protein CusF